MRVMMDILRIILARAIEVTIIIIVERKEPPHSKG